MDEYVFKRVSKESYQDLLTLHHAAFGAREIPDYYDHKMDTEYLGVSHLGYVAYTQTDEPAAFYGVYPYQVEYKGELYLACQSGDTMTHPKHVGKGLFTTLAKLTYTLAEEKGVRFVFGFPNNNSYPGFVKRLGWTHKENMQNYNVRIVTIPLAAASKKIPFLLPLYRIYASIVLSFFKSKQLFQPNSVMGYKWGGIYRDSNYTSYKKFNHNHIITIADKTAWVKTDGALLIGDIEPAEKKDVKAIIAKLKRLAFLLGCNKILFAVAKDTTWDLMLKDEMEWSEGIYVGYRDFNSGIPLENIKYMMADYDTF